MAKGVYTAAKILALVGAYVCAGKFGLSLATMNESVSAVWPPTGLALAALLIWGYRLWPAILVGAFVVNIMTPDPVGTPVVVAFLKTVGIATGNTLEALLGAWLVRRFAHGLKAFKRASDIFKFVALASVLSTTVSASCGATILCLSNHAPWEQYGALWFTWWLGDMVGDWIFAPLLIIWLKERPPRLKPAQIFEAIALLFVLVGIGYGIFLGKASHSVAYQLKYLTLAPLLWAALRFGRHGAISAAFIMSGVALWGTLHDVGPFLTTDANESLLFLQAFVGTMTITALVVSAVISERKQAEQRLRVKDAISRVLAEAATLKEATPQIIQTLCEVGGWEFGALWNVNRTANELFCVEVWHIPSANAPEFEAITRQRPFAPGIGLPGRVWSEAKPQWVPDVTQDQNFPRAAVAVKEGLHAAFCFPIKLGSEVLGVIECFSREIREPDENFLQMLSVIGNEIGQVIERRKAEELLANKEAQLRLITGSTPAMLVQCSRDLRYVFVNRAYAEMLGMPAEQIIGKPIPEVIGLKAFEIIRPHVESVLSGHLVFDEIEVPYKPIGRRFMQVAYVPEKDENGEICGWIASINDITERKHVEEAHRRIETLKGAILDSALDCIISINHEGKIIEFNPAAEKTLGYTRAEVLGQPMADLIIPHRFREAHHSGFLHYLATGEGPVFGRRIEMSALRRDGAEFPVELSISAIEIGNEKIFTATLRDITERKKTEAALGEARERLKAHADDLEKTVAERTQELRETIAEVESFSYSISHDMRGPLRAMQGYASVLEQELKGKIGEEESKYLGRIVSAASRLNKLVQDILSYSQVSRTRLQLTPIDLQPLMMELIQQNPNLQPPLSEIRIEGPLPIVLGHEAALMQICSNLLGNATKFVYPGTTPRIRVSSESHDGRARISIIDNGIGIDPKNHERIFQMFERVNDPKDYDGTGIGLAIVKKAVERMNGQIGVESMLGSGSRFWFELHWVSGA